MKNISILGSTGSIGINAVEVIRRNLSKFKVVGLSAGLNVELLAEQIRIFKPKLVSVLNKESADKLNKSLNGLKPDILWGVSGYEAVASLDDAQMVLSAMVGASGLIPTIRAIDSRKDIALANKETLVMAGNIVMKKAESMGVKILPVDSEHSAIFQCLAGHNRRELRRIILTASGGPFRNASIERLKNVTAREALKHPNWKMGKKITIDSATMMNKGLEVIEARWLFAAEIEQIHVQIHPQSIVHSMVEYVDGSVIAQLGIPDMKGPIAYALSYPERLYSEEAHLDLLKTKRLDFLQPNLIRFPCLKLAYEAGRKDGILPAVLNAANELAVEAFLRKKIGFMDIPRVIDDALSSCPYADAFSIEAILEADSWARRIAGENIERLSKRL
jgi:1-deoxy-D-xylulose-5-phosphate reductoisomerase